MSLSLSGPSIGQNQRAENSLHYSLPWLRRSGRTPVLPFPPKSIQFVAYPGRQYHSGLAPKKHKQPRIRYRWNQIWRGGRFRGECYPNNTNRFCAAITRRASALKWALTLPVRLLQSTAPAPGAAPRLTGRGVRRRAAIQRFCCPAGRPAGSLRRSRRPA